MELTDDNILLVLEELLPYIEADGGWLEYIETEEGYVKVRLGGACAVSYTHLTLPTTPYV